MLVYGVLSKISGVQRGMEPTAHVSLLSWYRSTVPVSSGKGVGPLSGLLLTSDSQYANHCIAEEIQRTQNHQGNLLNSDADLLLAFWTLCLSFLKGETELWCQELHSEPASWQVMSFTSLICLVVPVKTLAMVKDYSLFCRSFLSPFSKLKAIRLIIRPLTSNIVGKWGTSHLILSFGSHSPFCLKTCLHVQMKKRNEFQKVWPLDF